MLLEYLGAFSFVEVVDWADSELTAIRLFEDGEHEIVIVDLQLRQGSGLNVLKAIQKAHAPGIRIVYTNHAQVPTYRRQCAEAGADFFFDKSLEMDQVFQVIEEFARTPPSATQ